MLLPASGLVREISCKSVQIKISIIAAKLKLSHEHAKPAVKFTASRLRDLIEPELRLRPNDLSLDH